jgi:hypothetical protein
LRRDIIGLRTISYASRLRRLMLLAPDKWWYGLEIMDILVTQPYTALVKLETLYIVQKRWDPNPNPGTKRRMQYRLATKEGLPWNTERNE